MSDTYSQSTEIREGVDVMIHPSFKARYPEHHDKIFKVMDIDDEGYAELEWINKHADDRQAYVLTDHLQIV